MGFVFYLKGPKERPGNVYSHGKVKRIQMMQYDRYRKGLLITEEGV